MKPLLPITMFMFAALAPIAPSGARQADQSLPTAPANEAFVIWSKPVATLFQRADETQDQFTQRAMQTMRRFTRDTSFEASGSLCTDNAGRMGIAIVTWHAHFSAPSMSGCPLQTPILGPHVHTHPLPGTYRLTMQDAISINRGHPRRFFKARPGEVGRITARHAARFSPDDYLVGPGYLVSDDKVFYQEGRGTSRHVMTLPPQP